jgi:hypothetical protein
MYTGCLKIREFRIRSVVGKDPVELEKYLEKKIALPKEDNGPSNKFIFRATYGNSIVCNMFSA